MEIQGEKKRKVGKKSILLLHRKWGGVKGYVLKQTD